MISRNDISGLTIKIFKYNIEIVTIKNIIKTIAIYDKQNIKLIKRYEF